MSRECHRKERYFVDITCDKNTVIIKNQVVFFIKGFH